MVENLHYLARTTVSAARGLCAEVVSPACFVVLSAGVVWVSVFLTTLQAEKFPL